MTLIRLSLRMAAIALLTLLATNVAAQEFVTRLPIYIVNGQRMSEEQVRKIDPSDIVDNKLLPADEESVALYGQDASTGVVVITLR